MTPEIERFRVTVPALNIRQAPSLASKVLGRLTRNQIVEKIGETPDGAWIRHKENYLDGWSSKKYLLKLVTTAPKVEFGWMPIAGNEFGVVEFPGKEHNPRVIEYLSTVTNIGPTWRSQDETPWCSAFVNWCLKMAGYVGTNSALSTSWLEWGLKIDQPVKGCIAVFSRASGGHVGFYIDETPTPTETYIRIFGGNQQQMETEVGEVNLKYYLKSKLLGYRVPT